MTDWSYLECVLREGRAHSLRSGQALASGQKIAFAIFVTPARSFAGIARKVFLLYQAPLRPS